MRRSSLETQWSGVTWQASSNNTSSNNTDRTDWCLHPPTPCDSLGVNIIEIFLSLVGVGGTLPTAPLLPVNSPQVLQSVILGQDEDHCVVSVPNRSHFLF